MKTVAQGNASDNYSCREGNAGGCDCVILNYWNSRNYGAILTAYALQEIIAGLGYRPRLGACYVKPTYHGSFAEDFASKYLSVTRFCHTPAEVAGLNSLTDTFIVGSDQVWRASVGEAFHNMFNLDFVLPEKKRLACSASFGTEAYEGDEQDKDALRRQLRRFDFVSVREDDGVRICREDFGVEADHLSDPVFGLPPERYERLAAGSSKNETGHLASYLLKNDSRYGATTRFLCDRLQSPHVAMGGGSVEDWLRVLINSRFVVTDSFHCVCFALLFSKPFVAFGTIGVNSRFHSLFREFAIEGRYFESPSQLEGAFASMPPLDFSRIHDLIAVKRERLVQWLSEAMAYKKTIDPGDPVQAAKMRDFAIEDLSQRIGDLESLRRWSKHKSAAYLRYYRYRFLSKLPFFRLAGRYKRKKQLMKKTIQRYRHIEEKIQGPKI